MSIKTKVAMKMGRQILVLQKNSPKILFVSGIVGVVTSGVLACRATLKLPDTLDQIQEDINGVKAIPDNPGNYPMKEHKKDLVYVYAKGGAKLVRLYGPSVVLGTASIAALTGSHVTLNRRNASVTAAYAAVDKAFGEYRERVKNEVGEEKEHDLLYGTEFEKIKVDGKTVERRVIDPNKHSAYSRWFDSKNKNWQPNSEMNRMFVESIQHYYNQILIARGHVFLNEVYDYLGLERSAQGQIVGWVYDGQGDGYIDFGIHSYFSNFNFVIGDDSDILLDFNVDGIIFDKI